MTEWKPITATEPPDGSTVLTKISDWHGDRNEQRLTRQRQMWYFAVDGEYVCEQPTHYLAEPPQAKEAGQ